LTLALLQIGSPAGAVPVDLLKSRRAALMERIGTPTGSIKAPTLRSVEKLALALGVAAEWLAFGAGRAPSWRELRPTNDASKGAA